jgi:hypothetical protein
MLFELGAPFLIFAGTPGAALLVIFGVAFHVGIAVTMGLTTFVFAFIAPLPLLYCFAGYLTTLYR